MSNLAHAENPGKWVRCVWCDLRPKTPPPMIRMLAGSDMLRAEEQQSMKKNGRSERDNLRGGGLSRDEGK